MSTHHYLTCFADHRPVLNVTLRSALAILGGYGLAALAASAFAVGMPLPRVDAVTLAIMLSFIVYLLAVMWVFATATLLRAAAGLAVGAAVFGAWLWLAPSAAGGAA
ncbi:iron transporter [Pseudothauera rhizosphaerae]|uniref:Iron transporter n=1 Tax=Pseudothauera rhizosphaerae TaxID=2565932 RepID=A0A4S4AMJ2_9RHOO|nr:iron transporter [Pseudothauera rhizosphaerae]THF60726.1 iron transporter [Pseudothauera rhizosphaerae]